jgi:hypothetical protein
VFDIVDLGVCMSLDLFARVLGAVAPVVAVAGVMVANKVTDPPELPREYVGRVEIARSTCREATDYILSPLYDVKDATEMFLANRISKEELSHTIIRVADSIDTDMKRFYERLSGIPPEVADAVRKVFSPELIKYIVDNLRSLAEFARTYYRDTEIYTLSRLEARYWINIILDTYCRCLCETGVEVCKQ